MRYINMLQDENKLLKSQKEKVIKAVNNLGSHLYSDKFHCGSELDGYINISDVQNYLFLIRSALSDE